MDEPLGALDLRLRKDMQIELKRIQQQMGITFVYVTHDQEEALTMSDTVVVMEKGRIQQIGTPEDIYNEPKNAFVADFIGESNILNGVMVRDNVVKMYGREFPMDGGFAPNEPVTWSSVRKDIDIVPVEQEQLVGTVTSVTFKDAVRYHCGLPGLQVMFQTTDRFPEASGIGVKIDPDGFHIMKKSEYSGQFGDYSSYSEEYEELADALWRRTRRRAGMKNKLSRFAVPGRGVDGDRGGPIVIMVVYVFLLCRRYAGYCADGGYTGVPPVLQAGHHCHDDVCSSAARCPISMSREGLLSVDGPWCSLCCPCG